MAVACELILLLSLNRAARVAAPNALASADLGNWLASDWLGWRLLRFTGGASAPQSWALTQQLLGPSRGL